ncbi:hypothetical protein [Burkholderia multivorans]|uniref:hypothetical protein n=1 Tax=Burkholderia multivorans TaxID=87883 RepID=UPI0012DC9850|nr:hypothetical protein [Burkholderia multivorans]MBU9340566.1 hypothetical protein [Burkholderia multivorans]MCA8140913.1 hypothetical protein [Burkholderia multivorans]MCO1367312.1 hypothetical protein [Burkholderia multivorans]MCO1376921.1 hypothetical protein [Burkholderia multivorans]QGR60297.1 hypothetical protein FOC27_08760 [Burkholderia multivorans]
MAKKFFGTCALTGEYGQFVKSHLIPRALTRLARTGEKYIQSGIGERIVRVPDSWYDMKLVVRQGEDILADIDDVGITELRENRLIWSGWGEHESLQFLLGIDVDTPLRWLRLQNSKNLQLFFLSLLWRAAASHLPSFRHVVLTPEEIEDLRQRVLNREPGAQEDYPIVLDQISNIGLLHNRVPLMEQHTMPTEGEPDRTVTYVRFYFEGLVAKIYLARRSDFPRNFPNLGINDRSEFFVFLREFERSRTQDNLVDMMHDYAQRTGGGIVLD